MHVQLSVVAEETDLSSRIDSFHLMTISCSWFDLQRRRLLLSRVFFASPCLALCGLLTAE